MWEDDRKVTPGEVAEQDWERDLEKGEHPKLRNETSTVASTPVLETLMRPYINVSRPAPSYPFVGRTNSSQKFSASPLLAKCLPLFTLLHQLLLSGLSLSFRTILSRVSMAAFLLLFYLITVLVQGSSLETSGDGSYQQGK